MPRMGALQPTPSTLGPKRGQQLSRFTRGSYAAPVGSPPDPKITMSRVIFVDTPRGKPDRGWLPDSVANILTHNHIPLSLHTVHTRRQLLELVARSSPADVFWPLNYTYTEDPTGPYLTEALHDSQAPFIGAGPRATSLTSKLRFKRALSAAGLATPTWQHLSNDDRGPGFREGSVFIKAEYSCDSYGVRHCHTEDDLNRHHLELRALVHPKDNLFVESNGGPNEWTVAAIVGPRTLYAAPMGMKAETAPYVDSYAKHHNAALSFPHPDAHCASALEKFAREVTIALRLDGYFRIDIVSKGPEDLSAIDLNLLPALNEDPGEYSYFPMAFQQAYGWAYESTVAQILKQSLARWNLDLPAPLREVLPSAATPVADRTGGNAS